MAAGREELKKTLGERRVTGSLVTPRDISLEAEADAIRREVESGDQDTSPPLTPAEEIEAEGRDAQPQPPAHITNGIAARLAARRAAQNPQQPQTIDRTSALVNVVDAAYKKFLALGYEPETARNLTQAYALVELSLTLEGIAKKI